MDDHTARTWFLTYAEAFARFDAEAIADLLDAPSMVLGDAGAAVWRTREERVANFTGVNANHQGLGLAAIRMLDCVVQERLAPRLCSVDVRWQFLDAADQELMDFSMRYLMRNTDSDWKISVAVALEA